MTLVGTEMTTTNHPASNARYESHRSNTEQTPKKCWPRKKRNHKNIICLMFFTEKKTQKILCFLCCFLFFLLCSVWWQRFSVVFETAGHGEEWSHRRRHHNHGHFCHRYTLASECQPTASPISANNSVACVFKGFSDSSGGGNASFIMARGEKKQQSLSKPLRRRVGGSAAALHHPEAGEVEHELLVGAEWPQR